MADQDIDVELGDQDININISSITTANFVAAGNKFYFDGQGGDTYLMYNETTERLELWVKGIKQKEWGTVSGGDPFA